MWSQLILASFPVFVAIGITFGVWVVSEIYTVKYNSLTYDDAAKIREHGYRYTKEQVDTLHRELDQIGADVSRIIESQQLILLHLYGSGNPVPQNPVLPTPNR